MMVKKMQESDTENEIREAYRVFDKERTGVIAVSEMRLILSNLPEKLREEEVEEMLATADKDGNGSFSYEEFRNEIRQTLYWIEITNSTLSNHFVNKTQSKYNQI
jgi:Ca2+-binding EF-hand superfamily protein